MGQVGRAPESQAMLVKPRRGRRAEGQFMPGNVVGMRMRHEADLLPASDVERQPGLRKKQTLIPMKHGCIIAEQAWVFTRL